MRQTRKNLKLYLSVIANWTPTIPASTRIQFASHWSRYLNNWRIDFISTSFEQMNIIKYLSMHLWIYCKIDNLYIKPNFTSLSDVNFATLRSDKILLIIKNSVFDIEEFVLLPWNNAQYTASALYINSKSILAHCIVLIHAVLG